MENTKKMGNFTKYPKFTFFYPRVFSENMWNSECSLNNPDLVDNRSNNIVVAKIYQELLRYRPTLLFSVLLLIVELLHFQS